MAAGDNGSLLEIVVQAVDKASAVFDAIQDQAKNAFYGIQSSVKSVDQPMNAMEQSVKKLNDMMAETDQKAAAAAAGLKKMGSDSDSTGEKVNILGEKMEILGKRVETMVERFLLHVVVIGALMKALSFFKESIENAEKANASYTKQFDSSTETMSRFKTSIGDAILPSVELFKKTLADAEGQALKNKTAFDDVTFALFNLTKIFLSIPIVLKAVGNAFIDLVQIALAFVYDSIINIGKAFTDVIKAVKSAIDGQWSDALANLKDVANVHFGTVKKYGAQLVDDMKETGSELAKVWSAQLPKDLSDRMPKTNKTAGLLERLADAYKKIKETGERRLEELRVIHEEKVSSINEKLADLSTQYQETKNKSAQDIAELAQKNNDSLYSINESIDKTKKELKDLADAFEQTKNKAQEDLTKKQNDDIKTLAESFITAQDTVKKLQDQLNDLKTPDSIAKTQLSIAQLQEQLLNPGISNAQRSIIEQQIQQQQASLAVEIEKFNKEKQDIEDKLAAEEKSLNTSTDLQVQYAKQIADARDYANKTALEKAIYDFQQKQALAQQEYDDTIAKAQAEYDKKKQLLDQELADHQRKKDILIRDYNDRLAQINTETATKLAKIQSEIDKYKEQQTEEQALYDAKVKQINDIMAAAEKYRQEQATQTHNLVKSQVQEQIKLYNDLAEAIARANSARSVSTIGSIPVIPHADGGIVTSPHVGLVGEAGPEAIIPLDRVGEFGFGKGINVNITINGDVSGEDIVEKIGDKLVNLIKLHTATV